MVALSGPASPLLGDVLKAKNFAGLFGAAPSVALATLALTIHKHGAGYASIGGQSMLLGAIAFFIYASVASRLMMRQKMGCLAGDGACARRMAGCRARNGAINRTVKLQFNLNALGRWKWHEYAVRFAFGAAVTQSTHRCCLG